MLKFMNYISGRFEKAFLGSFRRNCVDELPRDGPKI